MQRSASPGEELQTKHSTHSAAPLRPADNRQMLDKQSQQKTSLFPPIIESNAGGGGGKTSEYYPHWHLAKCIEQPLSERDGLISGRPVPTQTTVLASFHCQHLRFELKCSMLRSQFRFPLFFPPYDLFLSKIPVRLSSPTQKTNSDPDVHLHTHTQTKQKAKFSLRS